ncbi:MULTISPECIES: EamA family transporter [Kitasatospora]|uniref:EamA domain-containing protein n=1 Tax=Kitasatospora cystarginea TaxID=58350 RepID=A0ABP5RIM8_9ACTN
MTEPDARWWDALLLLALIWGSSFLFVEIAVQVMPPGYVALARLATGAVTLLAVLAATGQRLPRGKEVWGHSAVTAPLVNVAPFTLVVLLGVAVAQGVLPVVARRRPAGEPVEAAGPEPVRTPSERSSA